MNEKLLAKFNEVEKKHWWWRGRRVIVGSFLKKMAGKKLLDVGCGTGETIVFTKHWGKGFLVWGVDKSPVAVKYAKSRGLTKAVVGNGAKLPFLDNYFDGVLLLDVLEHVENRKRVISEIKRVLKPGGKVLITGPALKFMWSKHDVGQGHKLRFSVGEMEKLAREAGMSMEKVGYFNFVLSGPIILVRMLSNVPGLGWMANYDNGINYDVAKWGWINDLLAKVFEMEVTWGEKIHYPWGVSIVAVLVKAA
jgi:SAM-dependent methyltransferase